MHQVGNLQKLYRNARSTENKYVFFFLRFKESRLFLNHLLKLSKIVQILLLLYMKLELVNNMLISPANNIVMNLLFIIIRKLSL